MDWLGDFHFLRPLWFFALIPFAWLAYILWQKGLQNTGLETHINQQLLKHLKFKESVSVSRYPLIGLCIAWFISVIILAGPTWQKLPQLTFESQSAVVVLLDLSPSMRAEDIKPSRIVRTHLKIQDLLRERKDGLTALIVYAGEAHIVTPFTDDTATISNLLSTLKPGILPLPGSNPEMAIELAEELIKSSKINKASILLLTDDMASSAIDRIKKSLSSNTDLTIIGVGTDEGAPIPYRGEFLKDEQQNNVISKRSSNTLQKLAKQTNGYYLPIQADASDIDFYTRHLEQRFNTDSQKESIKGDAWFEFGQLLILLLIPFVLFAFRRGVLLSVFFMSYIGLFFHAPNVSAEEYRSIWKNNNELGLDAWKAQDYNSASGLFDDPQWQGSAYYKDGDYDSALEIFKQDDSAIGHYNQGNALVQLNQFENAIKAYDEALKKDASLAQARTNKELVEKLLKEQEKQEQQQQEQKNQQENNQSQDNQQKQDDEQGKKDDSSQENATDSSQPNNDSSQNDTADSDPTKVDEDKEDENTANNSETNTEEDKADKLAKQEEAGEEPADTAKSNFEQLGPEERQALEQLLRKVPDDPSGLLRRKFEYEFQKRKKLYQQREWKPPSNNAHKRY